MDDTGSAAEKDTLVDISFYVPATSRVYEAIKDVGEEKSAAQVSVWFYTIMSLRSHLSTTPTGFCNVGL